MSQNGNPAWKSFVSQLTGEFALAQVLVVRKERGFELRHVEDRLCKNEKLRLISLTEVRRLSQFTASGAFRPLKSAPNLQKGWRLELAKEEDLAFALNEFYPNAIADWFVVQSGKTPITNYREFTQRQTGMYRITTMLTDAQAAQVILACCDKKFCAKRRLWTVPGLDSDSAGEKSLIPCLEPCALLLEFARKAMRMEQSEKMKIALSPDDLQTMAAGLKIALEHPSPDIREADFNSAANPRRMQLALEKLSPLIENLKTSPSEKE